MARMPEYVALLNGLDVERQPWMAVCQIAPADHRFVDAEHAAERSVQRALDLVAPRTSVWGVPHFTAPDLREAYRRSTEVDVRTCGIDPLLLGAVVEMAGLPIADVVSCAERGAPVTAAQVDSAEWDRHVGDQFVELLLA